MGKNSFDQVFVCPRKKTLTSGMVQYVIDDAPQYLQDNFTVYDGGFDLKEADSDLPAHWNVLVEYSNNPWVSVHSIQVQPGF